MTKKCVGCGTVLQSLDQTKLGYIKDIENDLCERCFKIRHYGEYKVVEKDNTEYLKIVEKINQTDDLVLLVVDLFNFNTDVCKLASKIKNPCILVFTKRDLFATDIYDEKFKKRISEIPANICDTCLISSKNNIGFDNLYEKIKYYQNSKNVYVIGLTNAGKSTMLNKFFKLYSKNSIDEITTSMLPSTTLSTIELKFDDTLVFIDTPGIVDDNIANVLDAKTLKRITPKKTIRPITYQIKVNQSIVIDEILRIDIEKNNNITLFFSNNLKITRFYKEHHKLENLKKHIIHVKANHDIVISGLGFIKVGKECDVILYTYEKVGVATRKSLI